MSLREEFVLQAEKSDANISLLCKRYKISRKTGYKWLKRYKEAGLSGLGDVSRSRHAQAKQTCSSVENAVKYAKDTHPTWGGRKIKAWLEAKGVSPVPAASTITDILRRQGYLPLEKTIPSSYRRFEHDAPNHLWQMDFKGHFAMEKGRCHPLTILDDHSRFSLCLAACGNEQYQTVKDQLIRVFDTYGLPERINTDNGTPWGNCGEVSRYTELSVWLIDLGVRISYSRPYHPQTNGKDERFHRTLKQEVLDYHYFRDLPHAQQHFDRWRDIYNFERPHEALSLKPPISRYTPSYRPYPDKIAAFDYSPPFIVKTVDNRGRVTYQRKTFFVGTAFVKKHVGLQPTENDRSVDVYYRQQKLISFEMQELT